MGSTTHYHDHARRWSRRSRNAAALGLALFAAGACDAGDAGVAVAPPPDGTLVYELTSVDDRPLPTLVPTNSFGCSIHVTAARLRLHLDGTFVDVRRLIIRYDGRRYDDLRAHNGVWRVLDAGGVELSYTGHLVRRPVDTASSLNSVLSKTGRGVAMLYHHVAAAADPAAPQGGDPAPWFCDDLGMEGG